MITTAQLDKLIGEASIRIGTLGIKVIRPNVETGYFINTGDGLKQVNEVEFIKASHSRSCKPKVNYDLAELDHVGPRDRWIVTEEALDKRRNGEEIYQRKNANYIRLYHERTLGVEGDMSLTR